jgi:tetratricopeptide (TPR) repeat protein
MQKQAQQPLAVEQLTPYIEQSDPVVAAAVHAALVHLNLDLGELARAHELVKSLYALEPDGYRPPYLLGLILKRADRQEEARDAFLTAVKKDEGCHLAWVELVKCCERSGDFERGLTYLQRASARNWPANLRRFWIYKRGVLYQQMGNYTLALVSYTEVVLDCLANGMPKPSREKPALSQVPPSAPLAALRDAVELLEARGLRAFPTAGTLLGWWREGVFLPHDKDIDIMLPPGSDWEIAVAAMSEAPAFALGPNEMGYSNFQSLVHRETGLVVDLSQHEESDDGRVQCVWRIPGLPDDQCRRTLQSPYRLVRDQWLGCEFWRPEDPDRYLTDVYGDWRTPMVNFDTVISGHHLVGFPDVVRCFAYSRMALALTEGRRDKSLAYVAQILVKDPLDPVSNRIRNLLAAQQGKEHD